MGGDFSLGEGLTFPVMSMAQPVQGDGLRLVGQSQNNPSPVHSGAALPRLAVVCRLSGGCLYEHVPLGSVDSPGAKALPIAWPEIRRDYPLNLSILVSGGKETNQDSLSNGE